MAGSGNGDNHEGEVVQEVFQGASIKLEDLKRPDGILTRETPTTGGLLSSFSTAVTKDIDYRQELKTAFFRTPEEADLAIEAINERLMCGVSIQPLVDKIIARSAGLNAGRLRALLDAYSHSTITTRTQSDKKGWFNSDKQTRSKSPLA